MADVQVSSLREAADYYTDGGYWQDRQECDSAYKVQLLDTLLRGQHMAFTDGMRLVEVGCGQGAFLVPLIAHLRSRGVSARLEGYDISDQAITMARGRAEAADITFGVGSGVDVPPGADMIFCMDVVEHVENPAQFLRDLAGKSRYVILHLPVEHSIAHLLLRKPSSSSRMFHHVNFYSMETSRLLIEESPFRVVASQVSASQMVSVRVVDGLLSKVVGLIRLAIYRLSPRLATLAAGGTVLWLLENT